MDGHEIERALKIRSESENPRGSRDDGHSSQHILPRGEYIQSSLSPKINMNKNLVKLKPLEKKDGEESELSSLLIDKRLSSITTSDSSAPSSEENTPKSKGGDKKPSVFAAAKRKIIDADGKFTQSVQSLNRTSIQLEKPEDTMTPKATRKKGNLYKLTIMQNASKFSLDQNHPQTATNLRSTSFKSELEAKLEEEAKLAEPKSALIKVSSQNTFLDHKSKPEPTFSIKNYVFGPKVEEKLMKKHLQLIMRGLNYSVKLLKPPPLSYVQSRQIMLKELKKKNTKTLVLDLDETLITSCSLRDDPDKILTPINESGAPIMIKIRPFAKEFLKRMKEHFEIILFTAAVSVYAETIIKELDPEKKFVSYILDRNFCLETKNGFYIKDLRIIKNRELKNMVLVDNLVHSFGFQVENGIPILEWTGNKADQELKYLGDYLIEAKKYDDLRDFNRQKLRLLELANSNIEEVMDL